MHQNSLALRASLHVGVKMIDAIVPRILYHLYCAISV